MSQDLDKIQRQLDKNRVDKALELIDKSLEKNTINPTVRWIYSRILSSDSLENYDLELSRDYIFQALDDYHRLKILDPKEFEKLDIDTSQLSATYRSIEFQTFRVYVNYNRIDGFNEFMQIYPNSRLISAAIRKRDSLAYIQTKSKNTWQSFKQYMDTYPNSEYFDVAKTNYDLLLFQNRTSTGKLSDYRQFVRDHPNSPFIDKSIEYIFTYSTLDHDKNSFSRFIREYPESPKSKISLSILFHLDRQTLFHSPDLFPEDFLDSLVLAHNLSQSPLIPVLNNGKVGYMNMKGEMIINPTFKPEDQELFCRVIEDDFLVGYQNDNGVIVSRSGNIIFSGDVVLAKEVGLGGIFVKTGEGKGSLIHKSGFGIIDNIDDAEVFANRWFKVKRKDKWALVSFSGILLTSFEFSEISRRNRFFIFKRNDEIALTNLPLLLSELGEGGFTLEYKYDDLEFVNDSLAIGFKDNRECLVDDKLNFRIPWAIQTVYPNPNVFYSRENDKIRIYESRNSSFIGVVNAIQASPYWLIVKQDKWQVFHLQNSIQVTSLDSAKIVSDFAVYITQEDSSFCYFQNGQKLFITNEMELSTLQVPGVERKNLLQIRDEDLVSIWNEDGRFLFQGLFERVDAIENSLFRVKYGDSYGVVDETGYYLLEPIYDFIEVKDQLAMLLKGGKIGVYDFTKDILIKPAFDAAFERIENYYKTSEEGFWGLIDEDGQVQLPFAFQSLEYFNDSLLWVQTDSAWRVVDVNSGQSTFLNYLNKQSFKTSEGTFFRVLTSKGYGVLSPRNGRVVPNNFSDIRLIGEKTQYLLAEHYIPEASMYVIVNYDLNGNVISSQALREEEYDLIYCE